MLPEIALGGKRFAEQTAQKCPADEFEGGRPLIKIGWKNIEGRRKVYARNSAERSNPGRISRCGA
jgi:hypothetical protein